MDDLWGLAERQAAQQAGLFRVPGADAKPEEIAAFRRQIGASENLDDYVLPEGADDLSKAALAKIRAKVHGAQIPVPFVKEMAAAFEEVSRETAAARRQQAEQAEQTAAAELEKAFGGQDGLAKAHADARAMWAQVSGLGDFVAAVQDGLLSDPRVLRLAQAHAATVRDRGLIQGAPAGAADPANLSAAELRRQIDDLAKSKDYQAAIMRRSGPDAYKRANDQMMTLQRALTSRLSPKS